jgi:hypothetical protein
VSGPQERRSNATESNDGHARNTTVARLFQGHLVVSAAVLVFSASGIGARGSVHTSLGFCDSHIELDLRAHTRDIAVAEYNSTLSDTICAVQIVADFYGHGAILCAIAAVVLSTLCMSVSE